ncbi:MAG: hypothetical protein G8D88_00870 [gamma proteobacterium symbiont of Ctena orbiculata]
MDNEQSQTTLRSEADSTRSGLLPLLGEQTNNSNLQALLDLGRKIGNENPISQFPKRSDPVSVARAYGDESVINPESPITGMDMKSSPGKQSQLFDIDTPAQVPAQSNPIWRPLGNEQSQTTLRSEADSTSSGLLPLLGEQTNNSNLQKLLDVTTFDGKEVYDIPNIKEVYNKPNILDITTFEGKKVYDIPNIQMDIMKLMYHNPSVTPAQIRSIYLDSKHSNEYQIRMSTERSRLWLRSLNTATDAERIMLTTSHKRAIEIAESIIAKNGKSISYHEIRDKYDISYPQAAKLHSKATFLAQVLRDENVIDSTKSITRMEMKRILGIQSQPFDINTPAPVPAQSNPIRRPFDNEQSQTTLRSEADSTRSDLLPLLAEPANTLNQQARLDVTKDTGNKNPISQSPKRSDPVSVARVYGDESVINPESPITGMDMKSSPGKQSQLFDIDTPAQVPAQSNPIWRPLGNEQSQTTLRSEADSTSSGLLPLLGEQTNNSNLQKLLDVTTFDGKEVYDIPNIKEVYNKPNILDITTFEGKKVYDIPNIQMDIMKLMYHNPSVTPAQIRSIYLDSKHSNEYQIRMSTERSRLWLRSLNTATDAERIMLTTSHKRAIEIAESIIANNGKIISYHEIMDKYNITYPQANKLHSKATFLAQVLRDENVIDSTKSITRTDVKKRFPLLAKPANTLRSEADFEGKEVYDIPNIQDLKTFEGKEVYDIPNIQDITTFEGKEVYDISNIQMDIMKLMYHNPSVTRAQIRSLYLDSKRSNDSQIRTSTERSRLWLRSLNTATDEERKMLTKSHKIVIEIAESIIAKNGKLIQEIRDKYDISFALASTLHAHAVFLAKVLRDENVIDSTKSITRTDMISRIGKQSQPLDIDTPAQVPAQSNDVSQPLDNEQSQTTLQKRLLGKRDAERAVDDMRNKRARKDELDSVPVPLEDPVNNSVQLPIVTPPGEGEVDMN